MSNIKILDCTLRDGGYLNEWNFGERTIKKIISKLSQANIDIIECGFLTSKGRDKETSLFDDVSKIKDYLIDSNKNTMYVAMIAYPNLIVNQIPYYDGTSIEGIRVTFHENEIDEAIEICKELNSKGYKVFVQPVGIASYDDTNILKLIRQVNDINPYAFYIVDTLGSMYKNDLFRIYYIIDKNLNKNIHIGFHSHNNLQLSFSNSQELMMLQTKRTIIIDSSVFGMGRGAGNLCTELLAEYINVNIEEKYNVIDILEVIDEHIYNIYKTYPWGYSTPYCLAAIYNCHPNYAKYLIERQTLSVKSISDILRCMDNNKITIFEKSYIEKLYIDYQSHFINDSEELEKLKSIIYEKEVLLLAPGRSLEENIDNINSLIVEKKLLVISINFITKLIHNDYTFISNRKRFKELAEDINKENTNKVIATSNIITENDNTYTIVNYSALLTDNHLVSDNAGLMLINLLKKLYVKKIYLAGFDGYSYDMNNYLDKDLEFAKTKYNIYEINEAMKKSIQKLKKCMDIIFITESKYS